MTEQKQSIKIYLEFDTKYEIFVDPKETILEFKQRITGFYTLLLAKFRILKFSDTILQDEKKFSDQYFEPDFVSLDPPGIEIQIPYGSESNSWHQKNKYIPLKKDIMKKNEKKKKIKWDDQRFFLRVKKKIREDLDFSGLQDKTIIFMPTDKRNQRLLAKYDGMEIKPHRATGFLFLRNVITLK